MRRSRLALGVVLGGAFVVGSQIACSELFEDAFQCTFDRDCAQFPGATCDVKRRVCVPRSGGTDGQAPGPAPSGTADAAPLPPGCDVSPKPTEVFEGTPLASDAGPTGEVTQDFTLDCTKDWILRGRVFVRAGATLRISAGTTIRAEKSSNAGLVVAKGARLVADGQRDAPIVFASAEATPAAGDWRGLVVLGNAPTSTGNFGNDPQLPFGGGAADDDSGVLSFVRVEHAVLGLVLAGVGRGTRVDSVEVLRSSDTCFSFQSGNVDAKHLVCQTPGDDMFDVSGGYTGRLQFLFGHRTRTGGGGFNGLEVRAGAPTLYNVTLCGLDQTNQGVGLAVRANARFDLNDAVVTGWGVGFDALGAPAQTLELRSSVLQGNGANPAPNEDADAGTDDDNGFDEIAFFNDGARQNSVQNPGLVGCYDEAAPKPWPAAALTTGARPPPGDGFFDTTATFIGAFRDGNDTWMSGAWVRFGP